MLGGLSFSLYLTDLRWKPLDSCLTFTVLWSNFLDLFLLTIRCSPDRMLSLFITKLFVEICVDLLDVRLSRHSATRRGYKRRQWFDLFLLWVHDLMLREGDLRFLRSWPLLLEGRVCFWRVYYLQCCALMVVDWRPRPNCAGDRIRLSLVLHPLSFVLEMFCALCSIIGQRRANIGCSDHQRARMDLLPAHGAVTIVHALLLYELGRDLV